ncbi:MAG: dihydrofolate reductase [Gemmatimonadota bacterium]|nr:dihydrofolate reductase [Gemmatimonadota bacterium]
MTVIAAIADNRVIGKDNAMPWHVAEDLGHFKKITSGGVLIMGRKTFESIGCKPLPDRPHVIVSRSFPETAGVDVCRTFEAALDRARSYGKPVFSAGGAEIYRQSIPLANRMVLSRIEGEYDGDTFFPEFDESEWRLASEEERAEFTLRVYERRAEAGRGES